MVTGTTADFNNLSTMFADPTWSRDNMQDYFKRIEKNLYLSPQDNTDHGFDGWLKTNLSPNLTLLDPKFIGGFLCCFTINVHLNFNCSDEQIVDIATTLLSSGLPIPDLNSFAGADAVGAAASSFTMDETFNRSSVHERLIAVRQASKGHLQFSLDTIATKILMCNSTKGVTAYGVEIAPGGALAVASNFKGKSNLKTKTITARHEVIVSAGVFQSPQLVRAFSTPC